MSCVTKYLELENNFAVMKLNRVTRLPITYFSTRLFSSETKKVFDPTEENSVIFEEVGSNGIITLNRPKAFNALNLHMIRNIHDVLKKWETNKRLVVIQGTKSKVFCSGGDVKAMILSLGKDFNLEYSAEFARANYTLNHVVGIYKKPYIAIIDGVTMGTGAGISMHGKYRIATENTLFAMPETAIGLQPDVGSTHFLSKLQGKLGLFLGLTGYQLKGIDVLCAGLATHYVPSHRLETITDDLLSENSDIDSVLEAYLPGNVKLDFSLEPHIDLINECFSASTVEEIIKRLEEKDSEFAQRLVKMFSRLSPTALKITKKSIEEASKKSLAEVLITDYRLTYKSLHKTSDFAEGVRALLIDKDKAPNWNPGTLEGVSDALVNDQFKSLPADVELKLPYGMENNNYEFDFVLTILNVQNLNFYTYIF